MRERNQFFNKKIIIAITVFMLVIIFIPGCEQHSSSAVPSTIIGSWVTDDLRYKDRYIGIYDSEIIFGTGENESYTLFINRIKKNIKDQVIELTLFCEDMKGDSSEVVIFYHSERDTNLIAGSIRLKNKESIVWHKVEE